MTLKVAIKRICEILEHPEYPQMTGNLIHFDKDSGEIDGKCALGEISCKVGLKLDSDHIAYAYIDIMKAAGVPQWCLKGENLPYMSRSDLKTTEEDKHINKEVFYFDLSYGCNLEEYIWMLNDEGLNYDEISEFLRCTFL